MISALRTIAWKKSGQGFFNAAVSIFDQAIFSMANLAVNLLVIHSGTKEEYGLYGIGYSAVLFAISGLSAFFSSQMTVNYWSKPQELRRSYCASVMWGQVLVSALVTLAVLGMLLALWRIGSGNDVYLRVLLIGTAAGCVGSLQDFFRAYSYLDTPVKALAIDILHVACWVGMVAVAGLAGSGAIHDLALLGHGVAGLAAGVIAACMARLPAKPDIGRIRISLAEAQPHAWWAFGGIAVTFAQNNIYQFVLALTAGAALVGEVNAARLALAPLVLLFAGTGRWAVPQLSRMLASGDEQAMRRTNRTILLVTLMLIVGYIAVLLLVRDSVMDILRFQDHRHAGVLMMLWAAAFIAQAIRNNGSTQLFVRREFRTLAHMNMVSMVLALGASVLLVHFHGAAGSIIGVLFGEICITLLIWRRLATLRRFAA